MIVFDLRPYGSGGAGGGAGGKVSTNLPAADKTAETVTHFFYGWTNADGKSLIRKESRTSPSNVTFKGDTPNFETDWDNRETLEYT